MDRTEVSDRPKAKGHAGGNWDRAAHEKLYGKNLNTGLGDFIILQVEPKNFLEFGSGLGALATYVGERTALSASYCLEPAVEPAGDLAPQIELLNVDVLANPAPRVLDRLFDLVLSIEVAEHVPRDQHEALFDFLVSRAGRLVVFSGARPGQGGHGHVAERPELEWREEFTRRGCLFDPVLTMRARMMSNRRNINHRKNIQVFHAPARSEAVLSMEARARPYLQDLLTLVLQHGGQFTGNLFYVDLAGAISGRPEHSLHWKRENLLKLAARAETILEIGFGAGHSALLCLLANPSSRLTIVDPGQFAHVQGCVDYLKALFPGRVTFVPGFSTEVLSGLPPRSFDLVHLDGGKDKTISQDLDLLKPLVARDHVLCINDTQNPGVQTELARRFETAELDTRGFESMIAASRQSRWTHSIARFNADSFGFVDRVLADMVELYRGVDHPSIYTHPQQSGRARAEYLISAVRDVETQGLTGAFVEVGVAAGHSSVIAALAHSRQFPRDFYLYDTFAGFGENLPDEKDHTGVSIRNYDLEKYRQEACNAPNVRTRLEAAGVSPQRLILVEGYAQETIARLKPPRIAILRLDADLFDPTYVALCELYDMVEPGGYVIVDDYGHWKGCADAVDRFFSERGMAFPGKKIDYTCYGCQV
ncbi:MAG: class I SAM-dependent methyltransferase [Pararhodobacter sp.]|nr:class I SAM-dependent methyltransferase [Pararhodobacter sp.]